MTIPAAHESTEVNKTDICKAKTKQTGKRKEGHTWSKTV